MDDNPQGQPPPEEPDDAALEAEAEATIARRNQVFQAALVEAAFRLTVVRQHFMEVNPVAWSGIWRDISRHIRAALDIRIALNDLIDEVSQMGHVNQRGVDALLASDCWVKNFNVKDLDEYLFEGAATYAYEATGDPVLLSIREDMRELAVELMWSPDLENRFLEMERTWDKIAEANESPEMRAWIEAEVQKVEDALNGGENPAPDDAGEAA